MHRTASRTTQLHAAEETSPRYTGALCSPQPARGPLVRLSEAALTTPHDFLLSMSPDARAKRFRANHRVTILAAPRRFELRHVAQRPVHAPFRRRMRIRVDLRLCRGIALQLAPHLRPAEEESLFRGEAIDVRRTALLRHRALHREISNL